MNLSKRVRHAAGELAKIGFVAGLTYVLACSKTPIEPEDTDNEFINYTSNTQLIESAKLEEIVAVQDSTLVFSESSRIKDSLKIGDVITFQSSPQAEYGFIGKVNYLSSNKDTVKTHPVPPTEAIESCNLSFSQRLSQENMTKVSGKGLKVRTSKAATGFDNSTSIEEIVLFDFDNDPLTDDKIVLDGVTNFNADITGKLEVSNSKIDFLEIVATFDESAQVTLRSKASTLDFYEEKKVGEIYYAPIPVGPVAITPVVGVYVGAEGSMERAKIVAEQKAKLTVGTTYENDVWAGEGSFENNISIDAQDFASGSNASAFISLRLEALVYGSLGAYLDAKTYATLILDNRTEPLWETKVGVAGYAGVMGKVWGHTLFDFGEEIFREEKDFSYAKSRGTIDDSASFTGPFTGGIVLGVWPSMHDTVNQFFKTSLGGEITSIDAHINSNPFTLTTTELTWMLRNAQEYGVTIFEPDALPLILSGVSWSASPTVEGHNPQEFYERAPTTLFSDESIPTLPGQKYLLQVHGNIPYNSATWRGGIRPGDEPILENAQFGRRVWVKSTQ